MRFSVGEIRRIGRRIIGYPQEVVRGDAKIVGDFGKIGYTWGSAAGPVSADGGFRQAEIISQHAVGDTLLTHGITHALSECLIFVGLFFRLVFSSFCLHREYFISMK